MANLALNESPSEKEGKFPFTPRAGMPLVALNESPSEKEGKFIQRRTVALMVFPSMKVPPKRKGNDGPPGAQPLIEVLPSMKVPPKRKGNHPLHPVIARRLSPSMKVPPKRKGNILPLEVAQRAKRALNESPSEKEGKCTLY